MREDEAAIWCRVCQDDAWHHLSIGQHGATKSCDSCGEISDHEEAR
jgi:hypothetical protein